MFWKRRKKPNKKMILDAEKHLRRLGYEITFGRTGSAQHPTRQRIPQQNGCKSSKQFVWPQGWTKVCFTRR